MPDYDLSLPCRPYTGDEPQVFVSYAHADAGRVYPVIKCLDALGYRIWYDQGLPPGENWLAQIDRQLHLCDLCLAFISPRVNQSDYVYKEIFRADKLRKRLILIYLEPTDLAHGLGLLTDTYQYIELFQSNRRLFENRFKEKLLGALSPSLRREELAPDRESTAIEEMLAALAPFFPVPEEEKAGAPKVQPQIAGGKPEKKTRGVAVSPVPPQDTATPAGLKGAKARLAELAQKRDTCSQQPGAGEAAPATGQPQAAAGRQEPPLRESAAPKAADSSPPPTPKVAEKGPQGEEGPVSQAAEFSLAETAEKRQPAGQQERGQVRESAGPQVSFSFSRPAPAFKERIWIIVKSVAALLLIGGIFGIGPGTSLVSWGKQQVQRVYYSIYPEKKVIGPTLPKLTFPAKPGLSLTERLPALQPPTKKPHEIIAFKKVSALNQNYRALSLAKTAQGLSGDMFQSSVSDFFYLEDKDGNVYKYTNGRWVKTTYWF